MIAKTIQKYFPLFQLREIIHLYERFSTQWLPPIVDFSLENDSSHISFQWIDGQPMATDQLHLAFYELGRFHRSNCINDESVGFSTLCHGDFHAGNVIESDDGIRFIDVAYLHIGNNFDDLDYLDFFDWFDASKYPWMIKDHRCFEQYLAGCSLTMKAEELHHLKTHIMEKTLNKFICNGKKNNVDYRLKIELLERIKKMR